jgi:hypothetical protein
MGPEVTPISEPTRIGRSSAYGDKAGPIRAQPRYAATWGGVMRVGLIRFHGSSRPPTSACGPIEVQTFFDGPVGRYAAGLTESAVICGSAYC